MKKIIALLLALVLCFSMFAACGNAKEPATETTETPTPDDGVLRVLLIGHSLGNNSIWTLPAAAKSEGYKDMVFGMLYYSGCRLRQHVNFLTQDEGVYIYRQFDINKDGDWQVMDINGAYHHGGYGADMTRFVGDQTTMKMAIEQQDWDIVVLQAGVMEASGKTSDGDLNLADVQTIMDYVNKHDIDKTTKAKFAWNMTWTFPSERELLSDYYQGLLYGNFADSHAMYEAICATTKDVLEPAFDWLHIIPAGTAMQNAHSSYMGNDVYCDTAHASDIGRIICGYTWLSALTGKDVNEMKLDPIPGRLLSEDPYRTTGLARTLTDTEKAVLKEAVSNAINNPYAMTQSAYTEAPAQ